MTLKLNLISAASGLLILLTAPGGRASAQKIPALQMKQTHYFFGDSVTTAANNAVRIENTGRFRYTVVAKAPDWRVYVFRGDDKTYFSESFEEFEDTGLVSDYLVSRREREFRNDNSLVFKTKFLGRPAIYIKRNTSYLKYMPLDKNMARKVEMFIYSAFKLPTNGGLPVESGSLSQKTDFFTTTKTEPEMRKSLSTSAINEVQVVPEIFELPKGYKKARSVREVVAGSQTREASKDAELLLDMGRR